MFDIKKYCDYLYNSLYIPVYLYDSKQLIAAFPEQDKDTVPPTPYLSALWESGRKVTYALTSFYSYYGYIQIEDSSFCVVIGPVNDLPYSNETLHIMTREFSIESSNIEIFNEFFHKIPQQNLDAFINTVLLINYTINQTELTRQDLEDSIGSQFDSIISKKYSEKSIVEKEEGFRNNNFEIERQLIRCIETGDIDKLNKFKTRFKNAKTGIIANNNLRHWKNTFIVLVALACRAAMKGGLTPSVAYQLSDIYIQQVERLSDVDAIMSLNMQVQLDYTNRVANSIIPSNSDIILHQVIQYIRENTNKNITVAEVANQVGFTRPSLSRKFKKELGFDVSTFIRKCKLEEAKDLLAFSGKSISEISSYLCFSSQSHFQKVFKDHFGITPDSYRRSV